MPLTILAQITAAPGKEDLVRSELEKLVAPTVVEDGCVTYELHADDADPAVFVFFEVWKTREHWLAHMEMPHLTAFKAAVAGALLPGVRREMTRIA